MSDLKPCPFCGHEVKITRYGNNKVLTIYNCTNCGCLLETGEEQNHGVQWNERANIILKHPSDQQHPDSAIIKAKAEAGYEPTDLQEKYLKLVDFVKDLLTYSSFDYPPVEQARELLQHIGEIE